MPFSGQEELESPEEGVAPRPLHRAVPRLTRSKPPAATSCPAHPAPCPDLQPDLLMTSSLHPSQSSQPQRLCSKLFCLHFRVCTWMFSLVLPSSPTAAHLTSPTQGPTRPFGSSLFINAALGFFISVCRHGEICFYKKGDIKGPGCGI